MKTFKEEKFTLVFTRDELLSFTNTFAYLTLVNCEKNGELQGYSHIAGSKLVILHNLLYPNEELKESYNSNNKIATEVYNKTSIELR